MAMKLKNPRSDLQNANFTSVRKMTKNVFDDLALYIEILFIIRGNTDPSFAVCGAVPVKTVFKSEQKSTNCPSSAYHDSDWQTLLVAINMARYQHARQGRDM